MFRYSVNLYIWNSFLGRVFHQMSQHSQAINYLKQGLSIVQSINKPEEEAKIRHQLGRFYKKKKQITPKLSTI